MLRSGYVGELAAASYSHIQCGGGDFPRSAGGMKIIMGSHLTNAAKLSNDWGPPLTSSDRRVAASPFAAMTDLGRDTSRSPDRTGVCRAGRSAPSQCEMVVGVRFRSPINLSVLTVPNSPCRIVNCGLTAFGMTAVSYAIWGMSAECIRPERSSLSNLRRPPHLALGAHFFPRQGTSRRREKAAQEFGLALRRGNSRWFPHSGWTFGHRQRF